jgi:hypothetical protein
MSTNKDLFKEAIADAKQVREAALVNAKAALEEALTPKLHSMLAAKLEEMNDNDEEETLEEVDYISANDKRNDSDMIRKRAIDAGQMSEGEEELEEDFDLSAILAELDSEESIDEAKKEDEEKMDEAKEETEDEESEEETEIEDETEEGSKITDLTVDELKDIIKDIISAEMGAEADMEMGAEEEMDMAGEEEMAVDLGGEDAGMEMGSEDDEIDEVDLDELLAELDALDEVEETESLNESAIADVLTALAGVAGIGLTGAAIMKAQDLLKQKNPELYSKLQNVRTSMSKQGVGMDMEEAKEEKDEMKEAIETIETLRNELHEQNLLNAKLLYVNKIFKAKNLTESQKVKVIASFDKATTPKQAKELFESIQNSEIGAKKGIVKESLGFASKAAGVAPKKVIVESNDVIARMQKLANIK